jgi:hypothetical protein
MPEVLPSNPDGFGFFPSESYVTEAPACDGHPCIVHRLDNRSDGGLPANPSVVCEGSDPAPGCVTSAALEQSVHCSCQCDGPGDRDKYCTCPDGFTCRQLFTVRDDGLHNGPRSYCVRPPRDQAP